MFALGRKDRELFETRSQAAEFDLELYADVDDLEVISPSQGL